MFNDNESMHTEVPTMEEVSVLKAPVNFKTYISKVPLDSLIIPETKKEGRKETHLGLTGVIEEFGVVSPIHVIRLEDEDEDEDEILYLILDGVRRVFSATKLGLEHINAVVWEFEDVEEGKDMANLIGLMLNRSQHFKNSETWSWFRTLELVNMANPSSIEYYLQLNAGDAMKLKDVMESNYTEIQGEYLDGLLTIEGAYKKLNAERKKENKLHQEESTGIDDSKTDSEDANQRLSSDAVLEMLEFTEPASTDIDDLNRNEDGTMEVVEEEAFVQDPKNRKPLDRVLRAKVLERDEYKCQCCGTGGMVHIHLMDIHHIIQVSQGGMDSEKNLITLCINCHHTVHVYAWGKLQMKREDTAKLTEEENEKFRKIFRLGNKIIEAEKQRKGGTSAEKLVNRKMPGIGMSENIEASKQ